MKKILILFIALLILPLAACTASDNTPAVINYGDSYISEQIYTFLLAMSKGNSNYAERDGDFWQSDEGRDAAELIKTQAIENAKILLYYGKVANDNDISVSGSEISAVRRQYAEDFGGDNELNKALKSAGFSIDVLNSYIKLSLSADKAKRALHGSDGAASLGDEDYESYFDSEYITLRHIFINKDSDDAAERADEIQRGLDSGAGLDQFADKTDDGILTSYPQGVTLPPERELYKLANYSEDASLNLYGLYYYLIYKNSDFYDALINRPIGEISRVETADGTFFVQRLTTDGGAYAQYQPMIAVSDGVYDKKAAATVAENSASFTEDAAALAAIAVGDVKTISNN